MPEVSPRRSSRARAAQPPPNNLSHHNSSSSSSSLKGDRTARVNTSQNRAVTSPSERSDETEQLEQETRQTRRQRREQEAALDPKPELQDGNDQEEDSEEDVTRCICGKLEYPGPPRLSSDRKETTELQDPDAGGLFIQCDVCHVWQHGGCVGIMDEASSPENYYCEQCRPNFHKIMTGGRTQRYSRYLPVVEPRSSEASKKKVITREPESRSSREADAKGGVLQANGKRRSTMNSRAAYDEEEVFRRVLEESKGNNGSDGTKSGSRKAKRTRDESDDSDHDLKRRKTGSHSPHDSSAIVAEVESDNESRSLLNGGKGRSNKTQAEHEREVRRRDKEREQERQAAASRRRGRADRRRGDEAEISQDLPQPQTASKNATANTQAKVSRSQASARQTNASPDRQQTATQKKANRPARRGKVGRNQYTRDRDAAADARAEAVRALHSRDGEEHGSTDTFSQLLPNGSKPSRPKHMNPNRTSMNELRKRAAGILEYISRTQVEMAGEKTPSGTQTPSKSSSRTSLAQPASVNGMSKLSNEVPHSAASDEDKEPTKGEEAATVTSNAIELDSFKQMGTLQMMDVLTREIVHWQQQHGKWGQ